MELIQQPKSRFLKVECPSCGNQQVVFDKASVTVKCSVCDSALTKPTGGKASVLGKKNRSFD